MYPEIARYSELTPHRELIWHLELGSYLQGYIWMVSLDQLTLTAVRVQTLLVARSLRILCHDVVSTSGLPGRRRYLS